MDSPTFTVEQQLRAQLVLARMANVQLTAQRDMLINIMRQEMHKTVAPANMFESLPMRLLPAPKTAFPFSPAASPAAGPVTAASPAASHAAVLADVTPVLSDAPVTFASMAAKAPVVNKPIVLPPRPGTKTPDNHSDAENVSGRLTPEQSMSHIEKAMRDIRTA
jgi:hypothetical protein